MLPSILEAVGEEEYLKTLLLLWMHIKKIARNKAIIWKGGNLEKIPNQLITIQGKNEMTAFLWILSTSGKQGNKQPSHQKLYLEIRFIFKIRLKRDCLGRNNLARPSLTYPVKAFGAFMP